MIQFCDTAQVTIYSNGDINVAKQVIRRTCFQRSLCVTVEPATFINSSGEETGYRIGLINYPRFPVLKDTLYQTARDLAVALLKATGQKSVLAVYPDVTEWISV